VGFEEPDLMDGWMGPGKTTLFVCSWTASRVLLGIRKHSKRRSSARNCWPVDEDSR
jgi:hypothetical protein